MKKHKTNTAFVKHAMEHSQYGGLKQSFIIAALSAYSKQIMADPELNPMKGFVDNSLWEAIACELNIDLCNQYGGNV